MNKAVFLDRDGVVNRSIIRNGKPYAPRTVDEFTINPDIKHLSALKEAGYKLIIATNQPDVANGLVTREFIGQLHTLLCDAFPFDDIIVCFHDGKDHCDCRKPKPGMLYQGRDTFNLELTQSFMIGDRWSDVLAGQAAGCKAVFIECGYTEEAPPFHPDFTCNSLAAAIQWITSRT